MLSNTKSEAHYRGLIMELPVAIYMCNVKGIVELYNQKAIELWGIEPEVGKDLWKFIQKKGILEIGETCKIKIIPFQFRQLMFNLVSNSLKFSVKKRAPHIKIKSNKVKGKELEDERFSNDTDYCHIIYTDNGIGFESEYSEKIFEVFQRLHTREKYQGTGIGLAIVKKIVENHDGFISAKGEPNKGATFDIYLPAVQ